MLNFNQNLRPQIDFSDSSTNFTQSLSYFPEDDEKALNRCEKIKKELVLSPL